MTTEEFKEITRAVILALREELTLDNKDTLGKLAEVERKLTYDGKVVEEDISEEPHNNLCRKEDGLYARNNYVTTESSPVGEIIAFMGTIAPEHYLFCDGSVYPIGSYPSLEAFFVEQFGAVNHFGGNGTTTFAVPDLRGEFLRCTGTATRNTGSGSGVGEHQEATKIEHFVNRNGASAGSEFFIGFKSNRAWNENENYAQTENPDKQFGTDGGVIYTQEIKTYAKTVSNQYASYSTRPTNTSVMYCIKYEPTCVEERRFLITRPDLWPENVEIDLGEGLYGFRKTGSITVNAHGLSEEPIVDGNDLKVLYSGGYYVNDTARAYWCDIRTNDPDYNVTVFYDGNDHQIKFQTHSGLDRVDAPYDVWVAYRKG